MFDRGRVSAALSEEKNEPLNWLLGEILREQAELLGAPHFLLAALGGPRLPLLTTWNATIAAFRSLLTNPDCAPSKAANDVRGKNAADVEKKLRALQAEVFAILALRDQGFTDFEVVPPGQLQRPDFLASKNGARVRVEVKLLQEPQDIIRTIAKARWQKNRSENPERYCFHALLSHQHKGALTRRAKSRLENLIDQLPDIRSSISEDLDGTIGISLKRLDGTDQSAQSYPFSVMLESETEPRLVVSTSIGIADFAANLSETQRLLLKVLRVVAEAQTKFFSIDTQEDAADNLLALCWEPPHPLFDGAMLEQVQQQIEQFFSVFELQLRLVIFSAYQYVLSLEEINRYK